jgi:hypothetical protein
MSVLLEEPLRDAPPDYMTVAWLIGSLHKRSFGLVGLIQGRNPQHSAQFLPNACLHSQALEPPEILTKQFRCISATARAVN